MAFANAIADRVVLESEQSVQHLYTEPPVVAETSLGRSILRAWDEAALLAYFVEK
jgi:hypothetical protein